MLKGKAVIDLMDYEALRQAQSDLDYYVAKGEAYRRRLEEVKNEMLSNSDLKLRIEKTLKSWEEE